MLPKQISNLNYNLEVTLQKKIIKMFSCKIILDCRISFFGIVKLRKLACCHLKEVLEQ